MLSCVSGAAWGGVYRCTMTVNPVFRTSMSAERLATYVEHLLNNYLPDGEVVPYRLAPLVAAALERVEHCFSRIHRKYYNADGFIDFDHLNTDHFAAFLYFLGNTVWTRMSDTIVPTKLFYLNKILHGLDLYFAVPMPDIFLLVHPVGTVIGNASYGEYFVIYQNCTVGSDAGKYPRFGEGVILYSRSSVVGACFVGDNVVFAANSFVLNSDVASDSMVVGQYPLQRVLTNSRSVRDRLFDSAPF